MDSEKCDDISDCSRKTVNRNLRNNIKDKEEYQGQGIISRNNIKE